MSARIDRREDGYARFDRLRRREANVFTKTTRNDLNADRTATCNSCRYRQRRKSERRNRKERTLGVQQRPHHRFAFLILRETEG